MKDCFDFMESLPETIFELDINAKVAYVNDTGLQLFGYTREDFEKGVYIDSLFHPEDLPEIKENFERILSGEMMQSSEFRAMRKNGEIFPVLAHSRSIFKDNHPVGVRGIVIDLTEHYKVRNQLEQERNFVSSLLNTANSLIICLDCSENIVVFNKECERITGYSADEVIGKNWQDTFIPRENRRKSGLNFSLWIKEHPEDRYEGPLLTKSGEIRTILWSNTVFTPTDTDEMIALAIGHDITERKSAESALRESEERYRAIWDNFPVGICLSDRDGIYQYVNPAYCRMYGYSKEELIGKPPDGLVFAPADRNERKKYYNQRFDTRKVQPLREYQFHRKTGESIWVQVSSDFIMQNGEPVYLISMNVDITKRKSVEAALISSEQRYRLLFENAGEAIFTVNDDGTFSMMNKEAAAYLGGEPEQFIGKNMRDLFPRKIADRQMGNVSRALERESPMILEEQTVVNNDRRWFRTGIYPIKENSKGSKSALLIARDITDEIRNKIQINARLKLLDNLRKADTVDECLHFACAAIYDAELFRRAVITLHNSDREIEHLGQVGLDDHLVEEARKAKAPSKGLATKMTRSKFRLGESYFVPAEARINYKTTKRYIPAKITVRNAANSWKDGDELFVPVFNSAREIEGWLSVDTPFDGRRPSYETVRFLEEITDIVTQRSREILNRNWLDAERKVLENKNIALKEILGHIEEEKAEFKQRIGENIENTLLPALNRILNESGSVNESSLSILKNSLADISTLAGNIIQLYSKLSPREIEICNLIRIGTSSKEIAGTLRISVATVLKHRETIRKKLGLVNRDINLMSFLNNT